MRVADGILDADDAVALLLIQWRDTTKLPLLTRELMGVARRRLVEPLQRLEDMRNIELAEGVWLDYIGERLGFRRPYVATRNVEYFGFNGNGVGFNQGPFRSTLVDTFNLSPVVDGVYRDCLKVWAGTLLHDGTIPVMAAAVRRVFPAAYYVDGLNGTLTLNIRTGQTVSKQVMTDFDVFPHPSGVALTVV